MSYPKHYVDEIKAERDALKAKLQVAEAEAKLATHKCITCGVAAENPETAAKGIYVAEWDSPQAQTVRKVVADRDRLQAEVKSLRNQVVTGIYDAASVGITLIKTDELNRLQAEVARLRAAMETDLIYVTSRMDEHPEGYEGACWCRSCCSYATDDGEGKP